MSNPTPPPSHLGGNDRAPKSLDELIAEQGVAETATFERLLGSAAELWADDAEFDAYLQHLRAIRHERD